MLLMHPFPLKFSEVLHSSQFPDVVMLQVQFADRSIEYCNATLISYDWALTAAHCFIGNDASEVYQEERNKDIYWRSGDLGLPFIDAIVDAINMKMSVAINRRRSVDKVIIYAKYGGRESKPQFVDDLALVHLSMPYSVIEVFPAALSKEFSPEATLTGTGFTNADGASIGRFNVGWPPLLSRADGQLMFKPIDPVSSSVFCQGDSGGPVFVGRVRGCKKGDLYPEVPPHLLQGVISYNKLGPVAEDAKTEAQQASSACTTSTGEYMQDITLADRRRWICRTTGNAPVGCR